MLTLPLLTAFLLALTATVSAARPIVDPPGARESSSTFVGVSNSARPASGDGAPTVVWVLAGLGAAGMLVLTGQSLA